MKYLLLGDECKTLFIEDDKGNSIRYDAKAKQWYPGHDELWRNRVGFDSSESEDSPYRYGNSSCMETIVEITHEEAETFISEKINQEEVRKLLKHKPITNDYLASNNQ